MVPLSSKTGGHCIAQFPMARQTHPEHSFEVAPEAPIKRDVDDRVVARMRHGQPMSTQPYQFHVSLVVDFGIAVSDKGYDVQRKPTHSIDKDTRYDHLDQLDEERIRK